MGAVLVDGANFCITLKNKGLPPVDYEKLEKIVATEVERKVGEPVTFSFKNYYRNVIESTPKAEAFKTHLSRQGWTVDERPSKLYRDGHHRDSGIDLCLALDAYGMALRGYVSSIVVVTHDSDFAALFERLPNHIQGFVVGWRERMARELPDVAHPIFLDNLGAALHVHEGKTLQGRAS